jgi:hypothetical protein
VVTVKFRHGTRFIPDFWYGRGLGWAKPFKSTVRARISYEPGARSSRRAVQGTMQRLFSSMIRDHCSARCRYRWPDTRWSKRFFAAT